MDIVAAGLGFITALLGLILAFITLWTRIRNGIKAVVSDVLIDSGLVKPGKRSAIWPNSSDSLPDFLETVYLDLKALKGRHVDD